MGNLATERFTTGNHVLIFTSGDGERQLLGTGQVGQRGRMGEGQNVDMSTNTGARPVHVVGEVKPQDIVDGAHTFEVTLAMVRWRTRQAADVANAGPIDINEIDINGTTIQSAIECHCVTGRISVQANNLVSRNLSFQAMDIR